MNCGFCRPPADGTAEREEVGRFAQFLRELAARGKAAVLADPKWAAYIAGKETTS